MSLVEQSVGWHLGEESGLFIGGGQAAGVSFAEPAITVVGYKPIDSISNRERDGTTDAQQRPDAAEFFQNLNHGFGLVIQPLFIEVIDGPFLWIVGERGEQHGGGFALQGGNTEGLRFVDRKHHVQKAVTQNALSIKEDDGRFPFMECWRCRGILRVFQRGTTETMRQWVLSGVLVWGQSLGQRRVGIGGWV